MTPKYVRVRYHADNGRRPRSVYLRDPTDIQVGGRCLRGVAVDREGANIGAEGVSERVHIIAYSLIDSVTPMQMNLTYGELEEFT